jgi:hypothetical protein
MPKIYVHRKFKNNTVFAATARDAVNATFGSERAFAEFFGGSALYGGDYLHPEFLGVWGVRNVSRFRRLLRERHGELEAVESEPPAPLRSWSTTEVRLTRERREILERAMR